jgi:hypothetical protein
MKWIQWHVTPQDPDVADDVRSIRRGATILFQIELVRAHEHQKPLENGRVYREFCHWVA